MARPTIGKTAMSTINIRIEEKDIQRIDRIAERAGSTRSDFIRRSLLSLVEKAEANEA